MTDAPDHLEPTETHLYCGFPWNPARGGGGCGRPVTVKDVFRCLDCGTAYCKGCLARHFGGEKRTDADRIRHLEANVDFWQRRAEKRNDDSPLVPPQGTQR